jgi:peptide/nickel transport system substrate-binding protein
LRTRVLFVIALLAGSVSLFGSFIGIASSAAATTPTKGGTLTYYGATENPGMSWTVGSPSTSVATGFYQQAIYGDLIGVNTDGKIVPQLAESVTATDSFLKWTIKLKPNLKFSDGTPVNAAAVISDYQVDANPATGGRCVTGMAGLASYTKVNNLTVQITLKAPDSEFPLNLTNAYCLGELASPTAYAKEGAAAFNNAPVGAGPYKLKSWVPNDEAVFVKNPQYWDAPRPYISTIIYKPVTDILQRANAFKAAGSSAAWCGCSVTSQYPTQFKAEGYEVQSAPQWGGVALGFNLKSVPALQNVNVRRAFAMALDLNKLNTEAAEGEASMATTVFPKNSPFYCKCGTFDENNLAQAQKLINAYTSVHGPISITFDVASAITSWGDPVTQELDQLKGVTINEQVQDGATTEAELTSLNYQMIWTGASGADPEPNIYINFITGGTNNAGYSNPQMDAALEKGRSSQDLSVRKAAYDEVQKLWVQDVPDIPIYRPNSPTVVSKNVKGLAVYGPGFVNIATIWLAK